MKVKELRNFTDEELQLKKGEFKKELFNLRCQIVLGKMENPARVNNLKKDVARIETILKENQMKKSAQAGQVQL